jgi:[acyl-carrier-protein] S-malonyltransferase
MIKLGMVFPGQGSQAIGMLNTLNAAYPQVKRTFAEASTVLNFDLWDLVQNGPEEILNDTRNTQPALLAAGVAVWRVWHSCAGSNPVIMAGHSLGEYSALVCAGAIEFTDAVSIVAARAQFMQAAVPKGIGAMAAILGLDDEKIQAVCNNTASNNEVVAAVNFNAPGQVVIAGHAQAVTSACQQAKQAGAKKTIILPVSVPSHCALMQPAAPQLAQQLARIAIQAPRIPVIHNACSATANEPQQIRDVLALQLYHPVNWTKTIQQFAHRNVTHVIECGPGKVLTGLNKRIDPNIRTLPVFDPTTLDQALKELT